jgi:hypothetical protein
MDTTYSTIASLLPFQLIESKPGLNPNEYTIAPAENGKFALTIIPNNVFYNVNPDPLSDAKEIRHIQVPVRSIELAQSIIQDYINSLLGVMPPDAVPGLFAVPGDWDNKTEFAVKHAKEILIYKNAQNQWFKNLVDIADDTWSKTRTPFGISDMQRSAAEMLGFKRDWLSPLPNEEAEKCPVCQNVVNFGAVKCISCGHILNKVAYDKIMASVK